MQTEIQLSLFAADPAACVLVVDDHPGTRDVVTHALQEVGFAVLTAGDARGALELAGQSTRRLDLVITDVEMPGMLGTRLACELWRGRPGLPVLFISGDPTYAALGRDPHGCTAFLEKPFSPDQLLARVASLLKQEALAELVA